MYHYGIIALSLEIIKDKNNEFVTWYRIRNGRILIRVFKQHQDSKIVKQLASHER
jgi:hypothetical protein